MTDSVQRRLIARRRFLAGTAASVGLLAGCSTDQLSAKSSNGATLAIGLSDQVATLDLPNFLSIEDQMVGAVGFQGLLSLNSKSQPETLLATSWKQVSDVTYVFQLRKGVTFQDGTPFNAEAVKVFFERAKSQVKSQVYYGDINSVTANSDYEVTFQLAKPNPSFIGNVAFVVGGIQSPASLQKYGDTQISRHPVGTGPYQLTSWEGNTLTYTRYDKYWNGRPPLDQIVLEYIADDSTRLAALTTGEIDVIQDVPFQNISQIRTNPKLQLIQLPFAQNFMLLFNFTNPILSKKDVRLAIAMAINKQPIIQQIDDSLQREANGFIPPEVLDTSTRPIPYDPAGARKLLSEAGYPHGFNIPLWTTTVVPNQVAITENIQSQLADVGIETTIVNQQYSAYLSSVLAHKEGLWSISWGVSATPDSFFEQCFASKGDTGSGSNFSAYANADADELISAAASAPTLELADKYWKEVDQLLVNDVAAVPLYWSNNIWAASSRVKNFGLSPLGLLELNGTTLQS